MEYMEIIGAVIGLLYLYLEYKVSIYLWPVGVIMPVVYMYIFYRSGFYADMAFNGYYLAASVYGWWKWRTAEHKDVETAAVRHTPPKYVSPLLASFLLLFVIISVILKRYTDSPVPLGDGFTTALSIVALWMLAHKLIEQWGLWMVVNAVSCGLYFWKGLYPTGALFAVYTIVPVFGYRQWKKSIRKTT